jgi:UDP-N-acetylbacillosamine N-acetyltransferase
MAKTPIVVWGASGHALVVSIIASLCGQYEIVGFIDDVNPARKGEMFAGRPILGGNEALPELKQKGIQHIALGFGHCLARVETARLISRNDFELVTLMHRDAVIADSSTIGKGTIVSAGVIIDPECIIGRYAIINNSAIISHGSRIDDGAHVCPGVSIGGKVSVGFCSWIGIGSCIVDRVHIGARSYIGAGSVVTKDIPGGFLAYGNPAEVVRRVTDAF